MNYKGQPHYRFEEGKLGAIAGESKEDRTKRILDNMKESDTSDPQKFLAALRRENRRLESAAVNHKK